jgi:hypothetical protein
LDLAGYGYVPVAGSCEHGIESSVSIKAEEFLQQLPGEWQSVSIMEFVNY